MEYPAIPLCISSKTNITKMQQFLNRVLRTATRRNEEDNLLSIAELHNKYKVEAINTRLYNLARKVWDKLETIDGELTARSLEENNPLENDHSWWRRISPTSRAESRCRTTQQMSRKSRISGCANHHN